MAYDSYIRPIVEHASPVWDSHTKCNTNKIEMVQRRYARYVTGNFERTSSVTSLVNCLSWPTLEERRRQYRLAVMFRILHNQVDIHWQSFLTKTSSCTRGHCCRLIVPFCKNPVYASSFFPCTSKDWNNPIFDPADAPSISTFIRKLRDDNAWISFFPFLFYFLCHVFFCPYIPPLMLCVYLQTFEAALFMEEEE